MVVLSNLAVGFHVAMLGRIGDFALTFRHNASYI
jgi:hypothetical protein